MDINIVTGEHWAFVFLCLIVAFGYSWFLYRKDKSLEDLPTAGIYILRALRFILVFLLCFLLLNPLLKNTLREIEKPVVIFAQDNSTSIVALPDSAFYNKEYQEKILSLEKKLGDNFELSFYLFGNDFRAGKNIDYTDNATDLGKVLTETARLYGSRKSVSMIVASDGIYNVGMNPLYANPAPNFPIYAIALGDTLERMDLVLTRVRNNKYTFLGNKFPVEITVDAYACKGKQTTLSITHEGKEVYRKEIIPGNDIFHESYSLLLDASKVGVQRYRATLSEIDAELSTANNYRDFFIEVIENRQKILILYAAPHPDISAIRSAIDGYDNYEAECYAIDKFDKNVTAYDLIILHQLPSNKNQGSKILSDIQTAALPVFYIVGPITNIPRINQLRPGLNIAIQRGSTNDARAVVNTGFSLFSMGEESRRMIESFPPLQSPFGSYTVSQGSNVLLRQKIGFIETDQPLLLFNRSGLQKTALLAGTGIWRWKIRNYAEAQNHNAFNELIGKIIQYMAAVSDKSRFRIYTKNLFSENENILLDAEVYNESYDLVNETEVEIDFLDAENNKFHYTFSRTDNAYRLNAGMFRPGQYRYSAKTVQGGESLQLSGEFTVQAQQIETERLLANHRILYSLTEKHGGAVYYPDNMENIADALLNDENLKAISYYRADYQDIVSWKPLFFILIALLTIEWIIRKRSGSY